MTESNRKSTINSFVNRVKYYAVKFLSKHVKDANQYFHNGQQNLALQNQQAVHVKKHQNKNTL